MNRPLRRSPVRLRPSTKARRFRPVLDALEDRLVPATLIWEGDLGAAWSAGTVGADTNWRDQATNAQVKPQNGDNLRFEVVGANHANNNDIAGLDLGNIAVAGGDYVITGNGLTLDSLTDSSAAGANLVALNLTLPQSVTFNVQDAASVLTLSGVIGGAPFVKNGPGTVILTGASTFNGGLVLAGNLQLDGSLTGGMSANGGVFSGVGSFGVLNASGGTIAPGDAGPGVLHGGSTATFTAAATFAVDINGANVGQDYDRYEVTNGDVHLGGAALHVSLGFVPSVGQTFTIITATGAIDGTFAGIADGDVITVGGVGLQVDYQANAVVLTALDATPPTIQVTQISRIQFGDADVGTPLVITLTFSEAMDQSVLPTLTFSPDVSSSFTLVSSQWTNSTHHVLTYSFADANVAVVTFGTVTAAKDLAGNVMAPDLIGVGISIDTLNPTVTDIDDGDADNAVGVGVTLTYTVRFSEDIKNGTFGAADLDNAGTAAITIGTITETSPGVFTVQVTPTSAGTVQLRIPGTADIRDFVGNLAVVPALDNDVVTAVRTPLVAFAAVHGPFPDVTVNNADGTFRFSLQPFGPSQKGGMRVATGDVTGDGVDDIIVAGRGGVNQVKVFDGVSGAEIRSTTLAIPPKCEGAFVAAGDVNGDGFAEVIVGAGPGALPFVQVYDGQSNALLGQFQAFGPSFLGGVSVAAGDLDGDGKAEIIAGAGVGNSPLIRTFAGPLFTQTNSFLAFGSTFRGGVNVAAGDLDGDRKAEIFAAPNQNAGTVRVFNAAGAQLQTWTPFGAGYAGGLRIAAKDLNGDGKADLIFGSGYFIAPRVRALDGGTLAEFFGASPFNASLLRGVNVG